MKRVGYFPGIDNAIKAVRRIKMTKTITIAFLLISALYQKETNLANNIQNGLPALLSSADFPKGWSMEQKGEASSHGVIIR
jgi:hypothetical protein